MKAVNLQICRRGLLWEWVIAEQRLMPKSFRGIFLLLFFFPLYASFMGKHELQHAHGRAALLQPALIVSLGCVIWPA